MDRRLLRELSQVGADGVDDAIVRVEVSAAASIYIVNGDFGLRTLNAAALPSAALGVFVLTIDVEQRHAVQVSILRGGLLSSL